MNRRLFFGIGFAVWLLATVAFRLGGHFFFMPQEPLLLALLWLATVAAMIFFARFLFNWRKLERAQRFEAAALLVISGMTLDAFVAQAFADFFPNMPASAAGNFGAWLLLAYASVISAAFLPTDPPQPSITRIRGRRSQ